MRVAIACVWGGLCSCVTFLYAQQELIGIYKGEYWERGAYVHPHLQKVTLRIASDEGGRVNGKLELSEDLCRGTYNVEGTNQQGQLSLRTSEGPMPGCAQHITLTSHGNKLIGSMSAESPGRPGIELLRASTNP